MEKQKGEKESQRMKELLTRTIKAISRKPPAAFTNKGAFCVSTAGINMTRTGQTFMITRTIKSVFQNSLCHIDKQKNLQCQWQLALA